MKCYGLSLELVQKVYLLHHRNHNSIVIRINSPVWIRSTDRPDLREPPGKKIKALYTAYMLPSVEDVQRLGVEDMMVGPIISEIVEEGETPVSIGQPESYNLENLYQEANVKVPPSIRLKMKSYEFYLVMFACTFRSHPGTPHPFVEGEFEIELAHSGGNEAPIAFQLDPIMAGREIQVSKKKGIDAGLKFEDFAAVNANYIAEIEYKKLIPEIIAFGLNESRAGWIYRTVGDNDMLEGIRAGYMIVKKPRGETVKLIPRITRAVIKEKLLGGLLPLTRKIEVTEEDLDKRWSNSENWKRTILHTPDLNPKKHAVIIS